MLLFLQYLLQKVNVLNLEFQFEHFRLHQLFSSVSTEYKNILSFYIRDEILSSLKLLEIDPCCKTDYKNREGIYFGARTIAYLHTNPFKDAAIEKVFSNNCLKFLIELSCQIKKRFQLDESSITAKL